MALWVCKQDGVHYAVDAPCCPQCGSTEYWEQGDVPTGEPSAVDQVPDGTADEVRAWVGDNPDRAKLALTAEQDGKKRATLIDQLTKLATPEAK